MKQTSAPWRVLAALPLVLAGIVFLISARTAEAVVVSDWELMVPTGDPDYPTGISAQVNQDFSFFLAGSFNPNVSVISCTVPCGPRDQYGFLAVGDDLRYQESVSFPGYPGYYALDGYANFKIDGLRNGAFGGWLWHEMLLTRGAVPRITSSDPGVIDCAGGKGGCLVKAPGTTVLTVHFDIATTAFHGNDGTKDIALTGAFRSFPDITYAMSVTPAPPPTVRASCNGAAPTSDGATLSWKYSDTANLPWGSSYLEVATDAGFANVVWADFRCAPGGCGSWNGEGSDTATASGLTDPNTDYFWSATVWNENGRSARAECGSFKIAGGEPALAPSCGIASNPGTIVLPQNSKLSWSCSNVDAGTCSIDQGVGRVSPAGEAVVAPTRSTVYTLSCNGVGPKSSVRAESSVDVKVFAPRLKEVKP